MPYIVTINNIGDKFYRNINVPSLTLPYCDFYTIIMNMMIRVYRQLNVYSPNFISNYRGIVIQFYIIDNSSVIYPYHAHISYDQNITISQTLTIFFSSSINLQMYRPFRNTRTPYYMDTLTNDVLVKYIITKLNIKPTDKCYDPVCGFGSFLIGFSQTINNLQFIHNLQFIQNPQFIQNNIFGNEIDNNKYRLLFHILRSNGLEDCLPNINNTNSLSLTQHETMREKFDIIAADIPYGSNGRLEVNLYPIKSSHIDVNFLQHIFFSLKAGGKAAVIIPTGLLSSNSERSFRIFMLECCQITEIIDLPPTNSNLMKSIIFFTKYKTTTNIKYTKYSSMDNLGLLHHDCRMKIIPKIDIIANDYKIVFE
jgi:hypothetical protein